jgi:hypothetical protein
VFTEGFWTHDKFMDVVIEVLHVRYTSAKEARLWVFWWVLGWNGEAYRPFYDRDNLIITDFNGWRRIDNMERFV